jgi:hypothetical protein
VEATKYIGVFRILGLSHDVQQTVDQLNIFSLISANFPPCQRSYRYGGLIYRPSSSMLTMFTMLHESYVRSLGLIRHELLYFATLTLPWAVQLRNSYDTIFTMGGFSESDLEVLINTLNQDMSDYVGPDVELAVSPVNNAVAHATQLTCLQLPNPDALTRSGVSGGHIQRGISRIPSARAYLDLLAF